MESIGRADAGLMEDFWSPPTPTSICGGGQAHAQATSETAGVLQHGRVSREIQTGDLERLGRLPGTRVEGERIASMLGVEPLLGKKAMEARIKACRSPRILHPATHGFFLANQRRDPNRELRGRGLLRRASRRWFWPNVRDAVGEDVGAWDGATRCCVRGRLWPDSRPGSKAGACRRRRKMGC
jgi:hypothetical protein